MPLQDDRDLDRDDPTQRSLNLFGGPLYIVGAAQYFIAQIYVAQAWNPPYDWFDDDIGDLGNTACAIPAGSNARRGLCSAAHRRRHGGRLA